MGIPRVLAGRGCGSHRADMKACLGGIGHSIQDLRPVPTATIDRGIIPFGVDRVYFYLSE